MTEELKNFLYSDVDIFKDIPKEVLNTLKEKIKNDEFFQLLTSLDKPKDVIEDYKNYIKACENPNWKSADGSFVTKEEKDECRELYENTLKRYNNYLKILIKTNGFETCNC